MENVHLKEHLSLCKHLFNHPTNDAERFLDFLRTQPWDKGLLIELECHRGHSIDYFRKNGVDCLGIHTDSDWYERATKLYPLNPHRLKDDYYPDCENRYRASAVFAINPIICSPEEAINCLNLTLKPGGYCFMHFPVDNSPGSEDHIKKFIEKSFDILHELKFIRLRYYPISYHHSIYEVIGCRR